MQCIGYPKQQKYLLIAGCICCHVIALRIMRQSDKYFLPAQVSLSPRPPSATTPFTIPQLCESLTVWLLMIRRASISLSKVYHKTPLVSTMIFNSAFFVLTANIVGASIARPLVQCLCALSETNDQPYIKSSPLNRVASFRFHLYFAILFLRVPFPENS